MYLARVFLDANWKLGLQANRIPSMAWRLGKKLSQIVNQKKLKFFMKCFNTNTNICNGTNSQEGNNSSLDHLVMLHRVLYGTIEPELALVYLHQHLRNDADLTDMGRPLKLQYKENAVDETSRLRSVIQEAIDCANNRESEWGERAEMAFEILYRALSRE